MKKLTLIVLVILMASTSFASEFCNVSNYVQNFDTGLSIANAAVNCGVNTITDDHGFFTCGDGFGGMVLTATKHCYENAQTVLESDCSVNAGGIRMKYRNEVSCLWNCPRLSVGITYKGSTADVNWIIPGNNIPLVDIKLVKVVGIPYVKTYIDIGNDGSHAITIPSNAPSGTYEIWVIINDLVGKSSRFVR
jgi:hypothetical protein